jgi:uncharacterized protein YjbJ (UPF0337 family)
VGSNVNKREGHVRSTTLIGAGQKAEGRRQKAEGRRQKVEGRRQKAEGRRQKAENIPRCKIVY